MNDFKKYNQFALSTSCFSSISKMMNKLVIYQQHMKQKFRDAQITA